MHSSQSIWSNERGAHPIHNLLSNEGEIGAMWWWRKVRRANIPEELRATFEQFGEIVIATFLAMGITAKYTYTGPLGVLNESWQEALAWLAERRDIQERREDRRETAECAISIWVVMGLIADIILVIRL